MTPRPDPEYLARLAAIRAKRKAAPKRFPDADERRREQRKYRGIMRELRKGE
jgi:hypothetical protein